MAVFEFPYSNDLPRLHGAVIALGPGLLEARELFACGLEPDGALRRVPAQGAGRCP
jgi:hypothetical protein